MKPGLALSLLGLTLILSVAQAELVWEEDFNGPVLDRTLWTFDVGGSGSGNGELQYYTDREENVRVEDGHLVIEARREVYNGKQFTSARLKTQGRMAFKYGTLEARIKVPDLANGLWPAFWMLGNNFGQAGWPACGELDIMEMGMKSALEAHLANRRVGAAAHWDYQGGYAGYGLNTDAPLDLTEDYHVLSLSWTPSLIRASLDGAAFWTFDISGGAASSLDEFHQPFFILLNLAVGGRNFVELTDPAKITAPMPAQMWVDWIRLYANSATELWLASDTQEQGNLGLLTETAAVTRSVAYGQETELYLWNNMQANQSDPFEGTETWSFHVNPGQWYGMGVYCYHDTNMQNFSDGWIHVAMKSLSNEPMDVGIASSGAGEAWVTLGNGQTGLGFARDGRWHELLIPLSRMGNVDYHTISQLFMLKGGAPGAGFDVALDDLYWIPSDPSPTPQNGQFGIFTENSQHKDAQAFALGVDGEFYIWENTLQDRAQSPYEGQASLSFTSAPGLGWFGAAFTPNVKYNLTAYGHEDSVLHVALKTSASTTFKIGMKSGSLTDIGQKWITFASGNDPYGFVRDGQWHALEIPMTDFMRVVNLAEVSQLFELLGVDGPISDIELDDIYLSSAGPVQQTGHGVPPVANAGEDQLLIWPASEVYLEGSASDADGTVVSVQWSQVSGPSTASLLPSDANCTWVEDLVPGEYVFQFAAIDNNDLKGTDRVTVTVALPEPTAKAPADQTGSNPGPGRHRTICPSDRHSTQHRVGLFSVRI